MSKYNEENTKTSKKILDNLTLLPETSISINEFNGKITCHVYMECTMYRQSVSVTNVDVDMTHFIFNKCKTKDKMLRKCDQYVAKFQEFVANIGSEREMIFYYNSGEIELDEDIDSGEESDKNIIHKNIWQNGIKLNYPRLHYTGTDLLFEANIASYSYGSSYVIIPISQSNINDIKHEFNIDIERLREDWHQIILKL